MAKVFIYVEGQTEDTFVKRVLYPPLSQKGIFIIPIIAKTKRTKSGETFKGGITKYSVVKSEILKLLNDPTALAVTTFIDYYDLPHSFPGKNRLVGTTPFEKVEFLENAFKQDIDHPKFIPYIMLHEFEALLFASPREICKPFPGTNVMADLENIRNSFQSPEEINEGKATHPSARIQSLLPDYRKSLHGPLISLRIGLDRIRRECHHFSQWLSAIERLV